MSEPAWVSNGRFVCACGRVRRALLASIAVLLVHAGCGKSLEDPERLRLFEKPGALRYNELLQQGEEDLVSGRLSDARRAFELAASERLFEVPNYEVLVRIAEVKCLEGDVEGARSLLGDYRCMLLVDSGRTPCYVGGSRARVGRSNPELSSECFKRMCGELYLAYYEAPTPETLKRSGELAREADRVERLCKAKEH